MAISRGNFSTINVTANVTLDSFPHRVSSTSDYLNLRVTWENNAAAPQEVSAIYWKPTGQAQQTLTRAAFVTTVDDGRSEIWYLVTPVAVTGSVDIAWGTVGAGGGMWKMAAVEDLAGVATLTPHRATTSRGIANGAADPSLTVTAAASDLILGVCGTEDGAFAGTGVIGGDHTAEAMFNTNSTPPYHGVFSRSTGASPSQTLQYDTSTTSHQALMVVAIIATVAGSAPDAETVTGIYTMMTMGMGLGLGMGMVPHFIGPLGKKEAA